MNTTDAEMNWTKTPPTEPVPHYWREHSKAEWKALELFINDIGYLTTNLDDSFQPVEEIGGEWFGRVPAPGTTFTEKEIFNWLSSIEQRYKKPCMFTAKLDLQDKDTGIAATTEKHRKEQG